MAKQNKIKSKKSQIETVKPKKRNGLKIILIILLLGSLLVCSSLIVWYLFNKDLFDQKIDPNTETQKAYDALLVVSKSNVTVNHEGTDKNLSEGTFDLVSGDSVKTDATGVGYIVFSDNSTLSLDVNTEVQIEAANESSDSFEVKVKQLAGRTWSRVENLFGKRSNYSVETPNTIAAVRGTIFSCDVTSGESTCYAIEHAISLKLKNLGTNEDEIILDQGNQFTNNDEKTKSIENIDELKKDIRLIDKKIEFWTNYNECLTDESNQLLKSDDQRIIDFLKNKIDEVKCEEVSSGETETPPVTEEVPPAPPAATLTIPVLVQKDGILVCTWKGTNATSYLASISTVPGKTSSPWVTLKSQYYSKPDSIIENTYYCSVNAKGEGGNSGIRVSRPVYFDLSSGSIGSIFPSPKGYYYGYVAATGKFSSISFSNLALKYSIRRSDNGKYLNVGTGWVNGIYWNVPTLTQSAADSYTFSAYSGGVDAAFDVKIDWVLYNKVNNKILDTDSVTVTNNW